MGADQNLDWHRTVASALDWWQLAGVDVVVEDAAFNWLAAPAEAPAAPAAPEAAPLPDTLPDTLDAFARWRLGDDAPEARWRGVAPAAGGAATAALMVLVDCPERDDRARLLDGEAGQLFDRMLAAIGLTRGEIVLAPLCVRRPTTGQVPRDAAGRLAEIARHHAGLVRPARLLTLGDAATRAILGTSAAEARGRSHALKDKDGTETRVVASYLPRFLLEKPSCKGEAWKDLLLLMKTDGSA